MSEVDTYGLPPVLDVYQTAEFLGLDKKTVYTAVSKGEMPGRKVGRRVVILRDALLDWFRSESCVQPGGGSH